jgi:hypothetical protein
LAALVVALSAPAVAYGSGSPTQSGVHVDPGSPTAKEYAVPLGSARGSSTPGGSGSNKLFGSGITTSGGSPPPSTSEGAPAATPAPPVHSHHRHRRARPSHHHPKHRVHRSHSDLVKAPAPSTVLGSGSGGIGIAWMLAAAALVLALGGLGAFAATRRGRRASPGAG